MPVLRRNRTLLFLLVAADAPKSSGSIADHPYMYGPPPNCKRKMRGTGLVCAHVYGLGWSESAPGQDGMRYALFPFTIAVLEDFVRMRV